MHQPHSIQILVILRQKYEIHFQTSIKFEAFVAKQHLNAYINKLI